MFSYLVFITQRQRSSHVLPPSVLILKKVSRQHKPQRHRIPFHHNSIIEQRKRILKETVLLKNNINFQYLTKRYVPVFGNAQQISIIKIVNVTVDEVNF